MSNSNLSRSRIRYFRWRWESCHGEMEDNDILKCILDNKAYCDARFKRIVMLSRNLKNNSGDKIASLIWECYGHNPGQLCNMWRWAEHLELFEQYSDANVSFIRLLWRTASDSGNKGGIIGTNLQDELTNELENLQLVYFGLELYRAYKTNLEQVVGLDQTTIEDLELSQALPDDPFQLRTATHTGRFEVGLEAFLLKQYLQETTDNLDTGWKILKLGRELDLSFLSSSQGSSAQATKHSGDWSIWVREGEQSDFMDNTLVFDVAGSGKTQKVFDFCSESYSHYLVATVRKGDMIAARDHQESQLCDSVTQGQDVLTFSRGGASQDMELLYKYNGPSRFYDGLILKNGLLAASMRLRLNRDLTLNRFLQRYNSQGDLQRWLQRLAGGGQKRWLLFQTLCGSDKPSFDPFYSSLDILLLIENPNEVMQIPEIRWDPDFNPVICLDEAQVLLADDSSESTDLEYVLQGLCRRYYDKPIMDAPKPISVSVISGTALRLHECTSALDRLSTENREWMVSQYVEIREELLYCGGRPQESKMPNVDKREFSSSIRFPLLVTDPDFESLLKSHIRRLMSRMLYLRQLDRETVIELGFAKVLLPNVARISPIEIFDDGMTYIDSLPDKTVDYVVKAVEGFFMVEDQYLRLIAHSRPLRGRYRWSILYIEHLVAQYLHNYVCNLNCKSNIGSMPIDQENGISISRKHQINKPSANNLAKEPAYGEKMGFSLEAIDTSTGNVGRTFDWILEQSKYCQEIIKNSLKQRLQWLELSPKMEHVYMLEDLYWTAIRADLMHKPCVLRDTTSGQLITQGFARIDSFGKDVDAGKTVLKQTLAEPLAVASVIEHLRAGEGHRHKRILERLLFDNQDDASSFGKTAEFYLAWSFGGLLRFDLHSPHLAPDSRKHFINILNHSKFIGGNGELDQKVDLEDYNLHTPAPHATQRHSLNESVDFHSWLQCIREENFFSTFYFPSIFAGPDIVFTMKHNDPAMKKTILIAIQGSEVLKTGISCRKDDAAKVLSTIDPNLWFSSNSSKTMRRALRDEMERQEWGKTLEIITILFTTSVPIQKFFAFKACQESLRSGPTLGKSILEETMQTLANENKTSISAEDGKRIVGAAHRKVTGKAWSREAEKNVGQSTEDETLPNLSAMNLGERVSQQKLIDEQEMSVRRSYRFALLEQHHTADFLGESTNELIMLIKDLKLDLPEDEGVKLEEEEIEKLGAKAAGLTVVQLKTCLKDWGIGGLAAKRKHDLIELILDRAKHLGFDEVSDQLEKVRKRPPIGTLDAKDPKKARYEQST